MTTLCMRVLRLQGAHVEQLMNADYEMCGICAALFAVCYGLNLWDHTALLLIRHAVLTFCADQRAAHHTHLRGLHRIVFLADWLPTCIPLIIFPMPTFGAHMTLPVPRAQGVLAEGLEGREQVDNRGAGSESDRRPAEAGPGPAVCDAQNPRAVRRPVI